MLQWFIPETNGLIFSGSFDLLPHHCLLPEFTPEQHANEVYDELVYSIHNMKPDAKANLLNNMVTVIG